MDAKAFVNVERVLSLLEKLVETIQSDSLEALVVDLARVNEA
jgi:hypothetical protein